MTQLDFFPNSISSYFSFLLLSAFVKIVSRFTGDKDPNFRPQDLGMKPFWLSLALSLSDIFRKKLEGNKSVRETLRHMKKLDPAMKPILYGYVCKV